VAGEPIGSFCPKFHFAVELIGRRWSGAIVRVLMNGGRRFSEIHDAIPGLSDRLLAERLRELEREGIIEREGGDAHGYALTQAGRELEPALNAIGDWAERWALREPKERSA
jgi:DNA-binding HxlR family transcriptional regulator